jgi:diketogulonate reductase-like aldo/keto reductase
MADDWLIEKSARSCAFHLRCEEFLSGRAAPKTKLSWPGESKGWRELIHKELGLTGTSLPEIGIGTWNYHAGPEPLRKGLESGAVFIDTAESYGTEPVVREAIKDMRDRVFVATKVSSRNFRSKDLRRSVDNSLQRLGVDQIDLLQLHQPNPSISIEETMGAMGDMVRAGKVRFVGVSNFSVTELQGAQKALGSYPIVSNQVRYNLIDRTIEKGLLHYCQSTGIAIIAYSPLARGLERIRDCDPSNIIESLVRETGKLAAQIIINWCLCRKGVFAIPKGNSTEHVLQNCGASGWRLSPEQLSLLDKNIRYRQRTRFDTLVRRYAPKVLIEVTQGMRKHLPRGLRRRLT